MEQRLVGRSRHQLISSSFLPTDLVSHAETVSPMKLSNLFFTGLNNSLAPSMVLENVAAVRYHCSRLAGISPLDGVK